MCAGETRICIDGLLTGSQRFAACAVGQLGQLEFTSAYWVSSAAYGAYAGEVAGGLQLAHVAPDALPAPAPGLGWIVDVAWYLFDMQGGLAANVAANLDALQVLLAGKEAQVRAFYVFDEPYLDEHRTPRATLEAGIALLAERFPAIPAYITFAHHCFDPSVSDTACSALGAAQRGIPANLGWVSFDWYSDGSCGATPAQQFDCHVVAGLERLASLAPATKLILTGEAFDMYLPEAGVIEAMHRYFGLASGDARVAGLDWFLWASVPGSFVGLRDLPIARATARALGRQLRYACDLGASDRIPIYAWRIPGAPEHDYRAWYSSGWEADQYAPQGAQFGLAPLGAPGTTALYACTLERGGGTVDRGYLTTSASCDGASALGAPEALGGLYTTPTTGTLPLYRGHFDGWPWDAWYGLEPTPPAGWVLDFAIGWVLPASGP